MSNLDSAIALYRESNNLNTERVNIANERGKDGWDNTFNCWGATLYCLNMDSELLWIDKEEMTEFLDIHTKEIDDAPNLKVGDILAMYRDDDHYYGSGLCHTAVYLGNGKYFHKKGGGISEITDEIGILDSYHYDKAEYRRLI